jgi:putative serine protease PepD
MGHVSEYDDQDRPARETEPDADPAPASSAGNPDLDDTQPVRSTGHWYSDQRDEQPAAEAAPRTDEQSDEQAPQQPGPYAQPFGQPAGQPGQPGRPAGQQSYGQPYSEPDQTRAYPAQPPYGYAPQYPPPQPRPASSDSRFPGWAWPVIATIALVVGALGGVIGGVAVSSSMNPETVSSIPVIGTDNGAAAPLDSDNGSVSAVAAKLLPSTVQIQAKGGADGTTEGGATGSGFVLDAANHVITNNHVVADATGDGEIKVVDQNGKKHSAKIVGRSPVYDIAVLDVSGGQGLRAAAIGSSRRMHVGDTVVAIGSPLGLSSTVTSGIVSAIDRPVTTGDGGASSYINAVQTDAAINPGNSGGPLVNMRGQVVGVNSAIATTGGTFGGGSGNIGVGFAIPMEQVRITASQILATGKARYPVIGANVDTGTKQSGAQVVDVPSGTPAAAAGLRKGDVVTDVNGKPITDGIGLIVAIRSHQPGETLTLTVRRDGQSKQVKVTLDSKEG